MANILAQYSWDSLPSFKEDGSELISLRCAVVVRIHHEGIEEWNPFPSNIFHRSTHYGVVQELSCPFLEICGFLQFPRLGGSRAFGVIGRLTRS